jgi:type II secretory pathway component PulF
MPQFAYRARDSALHVVEGTIEADNEASAIGRLGTQGLFPFAVTEAGRASSSSLALIPQRISTRTLAYTTRQLADLLGGGLPLLSALTLLARQTEHRALRRIIDALTAAVRDGRSLSEALGDHPQVFVPLYISMVRAGEVGGALEEALSHLADLGEAEAELRSRVNSALAYPLFVLFLAAAMTIFLMAYVIPTLSLVFIESGQLLPLPTRVLLAISAMFTRWWWVLAVGVLALGWWLRQWHTSAQGRAALDRAVIGLPGVGALVRKLETARCTRSLGILVSQGVPILQALDVVAHNVSNLIIRLAVEQARAAVGEGSSIAAALQASGQFPVFVSNMVAVGEESGTVDAALLKVAAAYERDVDRTMRTLTTLLEPVLLVGVGGVVMFIVLAMLLPIFQIGLVVQ